MRKLLDLTDVKQDLIKGNITPKEACDILSRQDNQLFIRQMLDQYDSGILALDNIALATISNIIEIAYYIYTYSGYDTGITDSEYDKLKDLISANGKNDFISLPLMNTGTNIISYHLYPVLRGSLSKVHYLEKPDTKKKQNKSRKSLDVWIDNMEKLYLKKTGIHLDFRKLDVYVFPKWDGVSVIFEFDENGDIVRALTRGYTKLNTAEDITHHFKGLNRKLLLRTLGGSDEPVNIPYGLKTEVMVLEKDVIEYNQMYGKDYKQSRAIASGIINSKEPDERNKYLVIMQLRYMTQRMETEELCQEVFEHPFIQCKLGEFDKIEKFAQEHRFTEGLRCDGAVIHIIDPGVKEILGRENDKNKYEVAYKFTEESAYTTVKDIEFQVGLLGRITPVVKVKPVKMKGNKISSASLSTMERVNELCLAKGDKVKILYDIIPYATIDGNCEMNRSGNPPIKPKEKCPSCGSKLEYNGALLMCNNELCPCRQKGKILNYLVKMRIMDISYATVDTLYDMGILRSIADIYHLQKYKDIIVTMDGFGEKVFDNWIHQINDKNHVEDATVLGAIGINGIAEKNFEKILNKYDFDQLMEIVETNDFDALTDVDGIGKKKAKMIVKGVNENLELIRFLWKTLDIYHNNKQERFSVCFTKIRDFELEQYIITLGGKVVDSLTTKTTYLVVPNLNTSSSKVKKAKSAGIEIVPIDKLKSVLNERYN